MTCTRRERSLVDEVTSLNTDRTPSSLLELVFRPSSSSPVDIVDALPRMRLEPLVASTTWRRISPLLERLPLPVHTLFFECRLQEDVDRTDFGVGVFPGPDVASWARQLQSAEGGRPARFLEAWSSQQSPWSQGVPFLFLAFDSDSPRDPVTTPCAVSAWTLISSLVGMRCLLRRRHPSRNCSGSLSSAT